MQHEHAVCAPWKRKYGMKTLVLRSLLSPANGGPTAVQHYIMAVTWCKALSSLILTLSMKPHEREHSAFIDAQRHIPSEC